MFARIHERHYRLRKEHLVEAILNDQPDTEVRYWAWLTMKHHGVFAAIRWAISFEIRQRWQDFRVLGGMALGRRSPPE
jgi:hypothetical protein